MQDTIPYGCLFVKNHFPKISIPTWNPTISDEIPYSPYMLDTINDIDKLLLVNNKRCGVSSMKTIEAINKFGSTFTETQLPEERGSAWMVRVSECKYLVATVFRSSIIIEKSVIFLEQKPLNESRFEAEFQIAEGKYSYLEWPHLSHDYIEKPYFLTLDDQGKVRIHYVKEKTEEIVTKEVYRCATFSVDGGYIYAINDKQEICQIDYESLKILMKRKIEGLSNTEEVTSSHIQQLTPSVFAIGSIFKTQVTEHETNLNPYLHLVPGDLFGTKEEPTLKIKVFEIPALGADPKRPIIFRSLYIKERIIAVWAYKLFPNGNITKNTGINLLNPALRGMVIMREERPSRGQKARTNEVKFHRQTFSLPKPPKIVILDGEGLIHVFQYYDTRYVVPAFSMSIRHLSIDEFKRKEMKIKEELKPKRKNRSKSQFEKGEKRTAFAQGKNRPKSQVKTKNSSSIEVKTTLREKQGKIEKGPIVEPSVFEELEIEEARSVEYPFAAIKQLEETQKTQDNNAKNPFTTSIKKTEGTILSSLFPLAPAALSNSETKNPFLSVEKREMKNPFTQIANQPTNTLFSSSTNPPWNSSITAQPNLFQKMLEDKASGKRDFDFSSKVSGLGLNNLFSTNFSSKICLKLFSTNENLSSKNASLFLQKESSDVLFKVEDQEFPARKSVMGERCKFFKNMFSSGMLESYSSVITIPETKASMFKAFLEYVYLEKILMAEDLAMNLFDFSERYILEDLKKACENCLCLNLTVDNFLRFYETACLYDSQYLKEKIMTFIERSLDKILERLELQDLPFDSLPILKTHFQDKPILGPSISQLIVR